MKKLGSIFIFGILFLSLQLGTLAEQAQDYTYYYNLGYAKLVDGSFNTAIDIFQQTLKLKPDCAEAYLGLGIAYRQINQPDKALDATQKALQYDPGYFKAYYNLGLIYEQQGKKKEAYDAYKTFYKKVPESRNIPNLKDKIEKLKAEL